MEKTCSPNEKFGHFMQFGFSNVKFCYLSICHLTCKVGVGGWVGGWLAKITSIDPLLFTTRIARK